MRPRRWRRRQLFAYQEKSGAFGTGVGLDSPPRLGAAERRAALLVNVLTRRELSELRVRNFFVLFAEV